MDKEYDFSSELSISLLYTLFNVIGSVVLNPSAAIQRNASHSTQNFSYQKMYFNQRKGGQKRKAYRSEKLNVND
jgi:hypothetical protein